MVRVVKNAMVKCVVCGAWNDFHHFHCFNCGCVLNG